MDIFTHGAYLHAIGMLIGQNEYRVKKIIKIFSNPSSCEPSYDKVLRKNTNMSISKDPENKGWVKLRMEDGYTIYTEAKSFISNIKTVLGEE